MNQPQTANGIRYVPLGGLLIPPAAPEASLESRAISSLLVSQIAEKDRRIQELLEANNRYLERARTAEAEVERLTIISAIRERVFDRIAVSPIGYRPIAELPDVVHRDVVLFNDCNGPTVAHIVLDDEAEHHRNDGTWTHFILLPEDA